MAAIEFNTGTFWVVVSESEKDAKLKEIEENVNKICDVLGIRVAVAYDKGMLVFTTFQPFETLDIEKIKSKQVQNENKKNNEIEEKKDNSKINKKTE